MLDLKQLKPQYVTNEAGERTAIILPIEEFQELLEDVEDLKRVIGNILSQPAELERCKAAARSIYEREFRAETVYGAFADHVTHVATLGSDKRSRTAA